MARIVVMKFGGAAVASPEQFSRIAEIILAKRQNQELVVVVVSAMGDMTDELIALAHRVNPNPPQREHDMLVSVGERISVSLLAMALAAKGEQAISFTGSQAGIITSECHSDASIIDVRPYRLVEALEQKKVVIVAGFQGVSRKKEITTLGRGGSDTTAVALAAALQADEMVFYKDVEGIYDYDPKKKLNAKLFDSLSFTQALDIVREGSGVLHSRCLELAQKNGIPLQVKSFLNPTLRGTLIGSGEWATDCPVYEDCERFVETYGCQNRQLREGDL